MIKNISIFLKVSLGNLLLHSNNSSITQTLLMEITHTNNGFMPLRVYYITAQGDLYFFNWKGTCKWSCPFSSDFLGTCTTHNKEHYN